MHVFAIAFAFCSPWLAAAPALFRYKEVQEQRFWQERLGTRDVDELGIDTNASFLADAVQPLPPGLSAPAPAPQPKAPAAPPHVQKAAPPAGAAGRSGGIKEKEGGIPIIIVPSGCVPLSSRPCKYARQAEPPSTPWHSHTCGPLFVAQDGIAGAAQHVQRKAFLRGLRVHPLGAAEIGSCAVRGPAA